MSISSYAAMSIVICAAFSLMVLSACAKKPEPIRETHEAEVLVDGREIEVGIHVDEIAYHWAPVHYQDINPAGEDEARADYITRIDRDLPGLEGGIWDLKENRDKSLAYPLRAYVYYSVVATTSHFFITYTFFHPWDTRVEDVVDFTLGWEWPPVKFTLVKRRTSWKTNDLEGVMFVVRRDGGFGVLDAVFTQGHGFLHVYLDRSSARRFSPRRYRGIVRYSGEAMQSMGDAVRRVITSQQAEGHGAGCFPDWGAPSPNNPVKSDTGGDHIRYIPSRNVAEEPEYSSIYRDESGNEKSGDGRFTYCRYKLINMFSPDGGLWYHRHEPKVFHWTTCRRLTLIGHSTPPWQWRGDKEPVALVGVVDLVGYSVSLLNLSPGERILAGVGSRPWTHSPVNLCLVYLKMANGRQTDYFSREYTYNIFLGDWLLDPECPDKNTAVAGNSTTPGARPDELPGVMELADAISSVY